MEGNSRALEVANAVLMEQGYADRRPRVAAVPVLAIRAATHVCVRSGLQGTSPL